MLKKTVFKKGGESKKNKKSGKIIVPKKSEKIEFVKLKKLNILVKNPFEFKL